jgi:hypothetical protein
MQKLAILGMFVLVASATGQRIEVSVPQKGGEDASARPVVREGLDLGALELPGMVGGALHHLPPGPMQRYYSSQPSGAAPGGAAPDSTARELVLLEVHVAETVRDAGLRLDAWLATRNSPAPAPMGRTVGVPVGDRCRVGVAGAGEDRLEWIVFTRGNVAVRVVCLDPRRTPHPELARLAAVVDRAVLKAPAAAGAGPLHPRVRLAAGSARCMAGDRVPLGLEIRDTQHDPDSARRADVSWVVGGAGQGQGYVEPDGRGGHRFVATGPGKVVLRAIVVGRFGTATIAETVLAVDEPR